MTLICILLAFGLEYYLGNLDQYRKFDWFDRYCVWMELNFSKLSLWNGFLGVLFTLVPPLLILVFIASLLAKLSILIFYLFMVAVFLYNLGPSINHLLNNYISALDEGDESGVTRIESQLLTKDGREEDDLYRAILVRAHDNLFGMIFWFAILGVLGVLLFNLVIRLQERYADIHGDYPDAVDTLYGILIWPSSRLLALGFALGGSLVDALEGWGKVEGFSLDSSRQVLISSGLGAMQHKQDQFRETAEHIEILKQLQALINRSLIIWLTVMGIMTITGWLS